MGIVTAAIGIVLILAVALLADEISSSDVIPPSPKSDGRTAKRDNLAKEVLDV